MIAPRTVIVLSGLPTSGKTELGKRLAKQTGLHFVDIDVGPALCAHPQEPNPHATKESSAREQLRMGILYSVLHAAIEAHLERGLSLIVCATYSREVSQDFLEAAVKRGGGTMKIVACSYNDTPEEVERRIGLRVSANAIGGCRSAEAYFKDKARFQRMKLPHIPVTMDDGETGTEKALAKAMQYIET